MRTWATGLTLGFVVGLAVATAMARSTSVEMFARVGPDGRILLDARSDESPVARVRNLPSAVLGEAVMRKKSWLVATAYQFTLQVRPEVAPGLSGPVRGLEVVVSLPGRVSRSNANRIEEGRAVWDRLPGGPLRVETRAVHWGRILLIVALMVAVFLLGRGAEGPKG